MITQSPQINAKLVDISKITEDYTNPLVKAFKSKGQVFGFTAPFIVAHCIKCKKCKIIDQNQCF